MFNSKLNQEYFAPLAQHFAHPIRAKKRPEPGEQLVRLQYVAKLEGVM